MFEIVHMIDWLHSQGLTYAQIEQIVIKDELEESFLHLGLDL